MAFNDASLSSQMVGGLFLSFFGAFYFSFTKVMQGRQSRKQGVLDEMDCAPCIALPKSKV